MELRTTREMRRNEQLSKAMARQTEAAPVKPQPAQTQERTDKLSVSAQAVAWLEEQNRKMWESTQERERKKQGWLDSCLDDMGSKKEELDDLARQLDVLEKCQKIAASIIKGNNVPPKDLEYLMNNDPDGYKLAMALRRQNPDPEDEKSVLDDEEQNSSAAGEIEGGGEPSGAPSVEAPAASEGGGDAAPTAE